MTKTRLKTTNGAWWAGFNWGKVEGLCRPVEVRLVEKEADGIILGKVEAREVIKTAKHFCGTELQEVLI
jgi:hypothetical protein